MFEDTIHISLMEPEGKFTIFKPVPVKWNELGDILAGTIPWSAGLFMNNYRKRENWLTSQEVMVFDIDEGTTLEDAKEWLSRFQCLIVTSKSHQKVKTTATGVEQPACDRFRIVIRSKHNEFVDMTPEDYTEYYCDALAFMEDMGFVLDNADKDCARMWFPSRYESDSVEPIIWYSEGKDKFPGHKEIAGVEEKVQKKSKKSKKPKAKECIFCGKKGSWQCPECKDLLGDKDPDDYKMDKYAPNRPYRGYHLLKGPANHKDLLKDTINVLKEYIYLETEDEYVTVASWIIGTYRYRNFRAYPYLMFIGLPGTGKSYATQISAELSYRGFLSSRMTLAAMRRVQELYHLTMGIDQLERALGYGTGGRQSENGSQVESFILSSYSVGHKEILADVNNQKDVVSYGNNRFGNLAPKVFDSVSTFNEEITSRCIIITMGNIPEGNKFQEKEWNEDYWDGKFDELRDRLMDLHYLPRWTQVEPTTTKVGRKRELLLPFTTMVDFFGHGQEAVNYITTINEQNLNEVRAESFEFQILTAIQELMNPVHGWVYRITSQQIADNIKNSRRTSYDHTTSRGVGRRLSLMKMKSEVRYENGKVIRGFWVQELKEKILDICALYKFDMDPKVWEIAGQEPPPAYPLPTPLTPTIAKKKEGQIWPS